MAKRACNERERGRRREGSKRTGLLDDPGPLRDQVRHPVVLKFSRERRRFPLTEIANLNGSAHEMILLARGDFGVTNQSKESITPAAPPPFPDRSRWAL
jgi:hypothetical protein